MQDFDSRWGNWPDDGDPIGTASARLLALGIERTERLAVLRLLGILLDHAGRDGVVRADPGTLAGEFRLERSDVRSHVSALRAAGILTEEPAGLRISGFANRQVTGLPEGEAMALIASVLGSPTPGASTRRRDDLWLGGDAAADAGPSLGEDEPALALTGAGSGTRPRHRQPVGAALAIITGLVLVAAGVFVRPAPDRTELSDLAAGRPATTDSISTPVDGTPGTSGAIETNTPAGTAPGPTLPGTSTVPGSTTASAGTPGSGDDAPVAVEGGCPAHVPSVSDVVAEVEPADLGSVVAASPWVVSVEGLLVAGVEAASVTSVPVVVHFSDGSEITGEGLAAPVLLEPGRAIRWQTTIDAGATTVPEVSSVSAGAPVWQWVDPELAGSCPGA